METWRFEKTQLKACQRSLVSSLGKTSSDFIQSCAVAHYCWDLGILSCRNSIIVLALVQSEGLNQKLHESDKRVLN